MSVQSIRPVAPLQPKCDYPIRFINSHLVLENMTENSFNVGTHSLNDVMKLLQAGQLHQAKSALDPLLLGNPNDPEAHYLMGLVLWRGNHPGPALGHFRQSCKLAPERTDLAVSAIEHFIIAGRGDIGLEIANDALSASPNDAKLHIKLGILHLGQAKPELAKAAFERALELTPDNISAHTGMANSLAALKDNDGAMAILGAGLKLHPKSPTLLSELGRLHRTLGDLGQAEAHYAQAASIEPNAASLHYNLGSTFLHQHKTDDAKQALKRAIEISPNMAEAHAHLGMAMMMDGDLEGGWPEYEWRWKGQGFPNKQADAPLWDGKPMPGKTLLLSYEQGYGDAFQFARYVAIAAEVSGARVVLEAQKPIAELMKTITGVDEVIERGATLPPFDAQAPLMTLPMILGTTMQTIPSEIPYLSADPAKVKTWAKRMDGDGRKIGLIWRGNPDQLNNIFRSCPPKALAPLLGTANARFFSLQKDMTDDECDALPGVVDLAADFKDFSDTAAAMANLDLVISVCTSTAHLAGALGRPTWVMLSAASDWRWFLDRDDSPWYPTAQLFRQKTLHHWDGVVQAIAGQLKTFEPEA